MEEREWGRPRLGWVRRGDERGMGWGGGEGGAVMGNGGREVWKWGDGEVRR